MTSPAAALAALIAELGEAKEGSRVFDCWIALALRVGDVNHDYGPPTRETSERLAKIVPDPDADDFLVECPDCGQSVQRSIVAYVPAYTKSLDAAMTLLPNSGIDYFELYWVRGCWFVKAERMNDHRQIELIYRSESGTDDEALEVCLACLRARSPR